MFARTAFSSTGLALATVPELVPEAFASYSARMTTEADRRGLPSGRQGLSREAAVEDQRRRVLQAMVECVAAKGYASTTVGDVTEAAGVSRTTFYELFSDKEDCFLQAYDAVFDVVLAYVAHAYASHDGPWPERVHAGLGALLDLLASEAAIAQMVMTEVVMAGKTARHRYRDAFLRFLPFLDEGRAHSDHSQLLPAATSRLAVGAATTLIFDEVRAGRAEELPKLLPEVVFAVLMPYLGPERAAEEMRKEIAFERRPGDWRVI
jgi:AcrR family transcriptional regulator